MQDLRDRIASLSPEKRALLKLRLKQREKSASSRTIQRVAAPNPKQLSFAQQRLWFLDRFEPGGALYNIPQAIRIRGELNIEALRKALHEIAGRHEALRTTFASENGEPKAVVHRKFEIKLHRIDLSGLPTAEREKEIRRRVAEDARAPFNLAGDIMLRAGLIQCGMDDHVLLLNMHHIASDGWSLGVLNRELGALYESFSAGRQAALPELPIQYADFARFQKQRLQGEPLAAQLDYWKKQLSGALPVLELPTARPRPAKRRNRGVFLNFNLPPEASAAVKSAAEQAGVTPFMVHLAALQVLLMRYSGQEDVVVGTPIAGRNWTETEGLIGLFVNTLAMRTKLEGNPAFGEVLQRVRESALGAYAHQDVPFEKLVEELQPERSQSHTPLFQVAFAMQDAPEALRLGALKLTPLDTHAGSAKFDITFSIEESVSGINGGIEYDSDLFDEAAMRRMIGHYQTLLEAALANPEQRVWQLPLLTADEKNVLACWNETNTAFPAHACIHELFEELAARTPHAIALSFQGRQLSYAKVNALSNQLAHHLRTLGVGPDIHVAMCMERSVEMVLGILGILKAGGVYVALDPAYPAERLAFMMADTNAPVILTQRKFDANLPPHQARVIHLDTEWEGLAWQSEKNPLNKNRPHHLAYVSYTSGSTGKPKGVCVPHRAVVRLVRETGFIHFGPDEVFLQFAPIAFDASTLELWGPLLNGACLAIFPPGLPAPAEIKDVLRREKVSTVWLTAGLFHQLAETDLSGLESLRQLLAGGDVLSVPHVMKTLKQLPHCKLINGYGPTENTTFTCCHALSSGDTLGASVPVGKPIANTQVHILDKHGSPVPAGIPGELYAGGDGLARGYLNRPDLTAEKFVPNPFSSVPGSRLYRTGDLVRYLEDGSIEFLGRIDNQVKIRGYRIEPGEVEAVLAEHPSIRECAVIVRDDSGEKRLVAYATPKKLSELDATALRNHLKSKLPAYMVPTAFVLLDALPLNANGKIDRQALPGPEQRGREKPAAQPWIPLHHQLIHIWEELLNMRPVGIRDNFFELGGHSLLAVRMMDRIEQTFGRKLPLTTLFGNATIENLAHILLQETSGDCGRAVKLNPGGAQKPFFYLHGDFLGQGLYCRSLARFLGEDQPVIVLPSHALGEDGTLPSIQEMAADCLKTVRAEQPRGPYLLGGFCASGCIAFEMARQLAMQGEKNDLLAVIDFTPPRKAVRLTRTLIHALGKVLRLPEPTQIRLFEKAIETVLRYKRWRHGLKTESVEADLNDCERRVTSAYHWILSAYNPRPYPHGIKLIFSDGMFVEYEEPAAGWRKLVSHADVRKVPGEHLECITKHVQFLADTLKSYLSEISPAGQDPLMGGGPVSLPSTRQKSPLHSKVASLCRRYFLG